MMITKEVLLSLLCALSGDLLNCVVYADTLQIYCECDDENYFRIIDALSYPLIDENYSVIKHYVSHAIPASKALALRQLLEKKKKDIASDRAAAIRSFLGSYGISYLVSVPLVLGCLYDVLTTSYNKKTIIFGGALFCMQLFYVYALLTDSVYIQQLNNAQRLLNSLPPQS
jgi:hypothetical protein